MEEWEMGMHKNSPKCEIFGIMGTPPEGTAQCHTFLASSFHEQHFYWLIV